MTTLYVNPVIGSDFWTGQSYSNPITSDKLMYVMLGVILSNNSATAVSPYTERVDSYDAEALWCVYVQDYLAPAASLSAARYPAQAIINASYITTKHAFVATLLPQSSGVDIAYRSYSTIGEADNSVACPAPAGIADNDIMLALVVARQSTGIPTITATGWTEVVTNTTYSTNTRMSIYWKRASSESGDYTFSHNGSTGSRTQVAIVAYDNCIETGNPYQSCSNTPYITSNAILQGATPPLSGPWYSGTGATASAISGGDTIKYISSQEPTSLGDCTFTHDSVSVTIPSGLILAVDDGESAWSEDNASTTIGVNSTYKMNGSYSNRIVCSAGATGKLGYKDIRVGGNPVDYSDYQQLSFWIMTTVAISEGALQICLCSDTAGATPVDTFTVPATGAQNFCAITIDKGAALGDSIQSVAVYATVALPAVNIHTDTIIACKAASDATAISLSSVISDHNDNAPPYYPIRNIVTTTVTLGSSQDGAYGYSCYFNGSSGTKAGYKIEPLVMNDYIVLTYESYTPTSYPKYSGGWDSSFSNQTGYTWIRGYKKYSGFYTNYNYCEIERLCPIGFSNGLYIYGNGGVYLHDFEIAGSALFFGSYAGDTVHTVKFKNGYSINTYEIHDSSWVANNVLFDNIKFYSTVVESDLSSISNAVFKNCNFDHLASSHSTTGYYGLIITRNTEFYNCTWTDTSGSVYDLINSYGELKMFNCLFDNGMLKSSTSYGKTTIIKNNQEANNHLIYLNPFDTAEDEATIRNTASGIAWKMTLGASTKATSFMPTSFSIAQVACEADSTVTVTVYLRRTNTELTVNLVCPGGQIAGEDDDISTAMTGDADTWYPVSIEINPTENGVVDIQVQAYGGNYSVYIDDLTVTQA